MLVVRFSCYSLSTGGATRLPLTVLKSLQQAIVLKHAGRLNVDCRLTTKLINYHQLLASLYLCTKSRTEL